MSAFELAHANGALPFFKRTSESAGKKIESAGACARFLLLHARRLKLRPSPNSNQSQTLFSPAVLPRRKCGAILANGIIHISPTDWHTCKIPSAQMRLSQHIFQKIFQRIFRRVSQRAFRRVFRSILQSRQFGVSAEQKRQNKGRAKAADFTKRLDIRAEKKFYLKLSKKWWL